MAKPRVGQYVGPTGLVDDISDAEDIRGAMGAQGPPGAAGSGGDALEFASNAEVVDPAVTTKVVNPHGLRVAIDGRVDSAAIEGSTERWDPSKLPVNTAYGTIPTVAGRLLPSVTADNDGQIAKVNSSGNWALAADDKASATGLTETQVDARVVAGVWVDARTGVTLTEQQKQHARDRIGAEAEGQGDFIETDLGTYAWSTSPIPDPLTAEDTGIDIPEGAETLLVRSTDDGLFVMVNVATLLALSDVRDSDTPLGPTNSLSYTDTEPDGNTQGWRIAKRGRRIYWRVTQISDGVATFKTRIDRLEPYADRESPTARIPVERLPTTIPSSNLPSGLGLSRTERDKLAGIEAGAQVNVNADWDADSGDAAILNKPSIPAVAQWALTGNTEDIPSDKLDNVDTHVAVWARDDTTDTIPAAKRPIANDSITAAMLDADGATKRASFLGRLDIDLRDSEDVIHNLEANEPLASTTKKGNIVVVRDGEEASLRLAWRDLGPLGSPADQLIPIVGHPGTPTTGSPGEPFVLYDGDLTHGNPANTFVVLNDNVSGDAIQINRNLTYLFEGYTGRTGTGDIYQRFQLGFQNMIHGSTLLDAGLRFVTPYESTAHTGDGNQNAVPIYLPGGPTIYVGATAAGYLAVANSTASDPNSGARERYQTKILVTAISRAEEFLRTDFVGETRRNNRLIYAPGSGETGSGANWTNNTFFFNFFGSASNRPRPIVCTGPVRDGFAREWTALTGSGVTDRKPTGSSPTGVSFAQDSSDTFSIGRGNGGQVAIAVSDANAWGLGTAGHGRLFKLPNPSVLGTLANVDWVQGNRFAENLAHPLNIRGLYWWEGVQTLANGGDESYFLSPPFTGRLMHKLNSRFYSANAQQARPQQAGNNAQNCVSLGPWPGFTTVYMGLSTGLHPLISADGTRSGATYTMRLVGYEPS